MWQGGSSTMLAVALLAFSDAYTYQTFFRVFTVVVIFAMFYGTLLLPVILSIFKPKPYNIKKSTHDQPEETELFMIAKPDESALKIENDIRNSICDNKEIEKLNGNGTIE